MRANTVRRRVVLFVALMTCSLSGCTLRNFFGWAADSTYNSPVERQEVKDRMNEHWKD
jgi:hypothetical protein